MVEIVMGLLQELSEDGVTICLVTHDPSYAGRAGRKIRLFDGMIVGPEPDLKGRPDLDP